MIGVRLQARSREQAILVEWSTKTLAQFIAATVPTAKGKTNKLLKSAQGIALVSRTQDDTETEEPRSTSHEPAPGSFERFMGTFGRVADRRR